MKKYKNNVINIFSRIVFAFALISVWEILVRNGTLNEAYIASPTKIALVLQNIIVSGELIGHLFHSLYNFIIGFIISIILGILIGLILGTNTKIYSLLAPYFYGLQAIPKVVFLPLIIIWFGIAVKARIAFIVVMSIAPIVTAVAEGVRSVSDEYIALAESFEAKGLFMISNIYFMAAMPSIINGIKQSVGWAFIGMIIIEYYGINIGLGSQIAYYGASLQVESLFAYVVLVIALDLFIMGIFNLVSKNFLRWKVGADERY